MANGNKGFSSLLTDSLDEDLTDDEAAPARSVMASRSEALNRLASGKVVTDRTEFVDPARCRPWRLHNRDLDHLTEESCRDLIDGLHQSENKVHQSNGICSTRAFFFKVALQKCPPSKTSPENGTF